MTNGLNPKLDEWTTSQVWPSLTAANEILRCPKPLAGSGGRHWWYNDHEAMEEMLEANVQLPHIPIVCKTCSIRLKLSIDANDGPEI